jgi:hypothetical protein
MSDRVLVACEFSGVVRNAFTARGFDAWSCDTLPTEAPGNHYQCDVREVLDRDWDLMIAHPPCTYIARSGARWLRERPGRIEKQKQALDFVRLLLDAPIPFIALENPIGAISTHIRKPDQIIHPWQFGHGETKATCLWLKGLPHLAPTNIVPGRETRIWFMAPSEDRAKERSRTYTGIAEAMANQWGNVLRGEAEQTPYQIRMWSFSEECKTG